jgi:hypothetical protein
LSVRSDPRDVRERIDAHVAAIENEDRRSFDVREDPDLSDAVRAIWTDLWVTDGTETAEVPDGYIALGYPPDSATLGSDQLNEAIQLQAEKPDNLRKLDVTASERHLYCVRGLARLPGALGDEERIASVRVPQSIRDNHACMGCRSGWSGRRPRSLDCRSQNRMECSWRLSALKNANQLTDSPRLPAPCGSWS